MVLNKDRLRTKLQDIASAVDRLKRLQSISRDSFLADEDSQDIARSRLLTAIEAALNICFHVAAKEMKQVPEEYGQCFTLLGSSGIIPQDLATRLVPMAKFRNRLVHLYWDIDYDQIYSILQSHLGDLEEFSIEAAKLL